MALSEHDVAGIADYARIGLTPEELTEMTSYMNDAIDMLEPVLKYGEADVPPTFHPIGDLSNVMGTDEERPGLSLEDALLDAPSAHERYFRVPSILGESEA